MNFRVDPDNITNFGLDDEQLELHAVFWICVAGKTAAIICRAVEKIFVELSIRWPNQRPLAMLKKVGQKELPLLLKRHGIGCFNLKGESLWQLSNSGLNLRTCSYEELRRIKGMGRKTAKCFLIHSRKDSQVAGLDTHVLKGLRRRGYDAPLSTPSSDKVYQHWEKIVLEIVKRENKTPAEWDLQEWKLGKQETRQLNTSVSADPVTSLTYTSAVSPCGDGIVGLDEGSALTRGSDACKARPV
jgi:endonuclease III